MKKGLLYAILASVLWAIVNPFIKQGLSYDFTPMNFAGIRFTSVGILLFAYTWHKGMWEEIKRHRRLFLNLIFINMLMGYTAFYFGVDFVSGAISSIIMGMTPLINVLLAHLLASNDKLNGYKIVSLIVSLAGLLLIVGTGSDGEPLDRHHRHCPIVAQHHLSGIFRHLRIRGERQGQPHFPECRTDVFWWRTYLHHRAKYGRLPLFHRQTCRILYQSGHSGVHFRIRIQLLVYGAAKQGRKSQRHQYVPSHQPHSRSSVKLDNACRRIPHFQYGGRNVDYRQLTGYLLQRGGNCKILQYTEAVKEKE